MKRHADQFSHTQRQKNDRKNEMAQTAKSPLNLCDVSQDHPNDRGCNNAANSPSDEVLQNGMRPFHFWGLLFLDA
jgi:hypothetical protein